MSRLVVLFSTIGVIGIFLFLAYHFQKPTILISPFVETPKKDPSGRLKEIVEKVLNTSDGSYGIVVKHLKTGESYYGNEHKSFESGSLYKIWVLATAFDQIEKGKLKEDEILSQDVGILNSEFDIATESAEQTDGTMTYSVKDAMEQMITISHNYAALLLSERLGFSTVEAYLKKHQLLESQLGEPPQTTALDVALFFEKLYTGELANKENTQKMIDLFKRQTINQKLPKYLPEKVTVAHKTGEINTFTHDAGIVYTKNGDYVVAILSESDIPADAEEKIAQLSKAVYEYFNK